MKFLLLTLLIAIECIIHTNSYKLVSTNFVPERFQIKLKEQQYPDLLFPANRQGSIYDEPDESLSYKKAVQALAEAAEAYNGNDIDDIDEGSNESLELFGDNKYEDVEIKADPRDEETESHSSLVGGHQYVSGGAGEGKQHLHPDGSYHNKEEVKSDEDLPAYCDPPNPCPIGYTGEDCDSRPFNEYTAEYSKSYQEHQNCMCDEDHNECKKFHKSSDKVDDFINGFKDSKYSQVVAKKSPRIRREAKSNPYLRGKPIKLHVAKKSL